MNLNKENIKQTVNSMIDDIDLNIQLVNKKMKDLPDELTNQFNDALDQVSIEKDKIIDNSQEMYEQLKSKLKKINQDVEKAFSELLEF